MRLALLSFAVLLAAHAGLAMADYAYDIQLSRMDKLCKVDTTFCK
jgi:hypothetical protein